MTEYNPTKCIVGFSTDQQCKAKRRRGLYCNAHHVRARRARATTFESNDMFSSKTAMNSVQLDAAIVLLEEQDASTSEG